MASAASTSSSFHSSSLRLASGARLSQRSIAYRRFAPQLSPRCRIALECYRIQLLCRHSRILRSCLPSAALSLVYSLPSRSGCVVPTCLLSGRLQYAAAVGLQVFVYTALGYRASHIRLFDSEYYVFFISMLHCSRPYRSSRYEYYVFFTPRPASIVYILTLDLPALQLLASLRVYRCRSAPHPGVLRCAIACSLLPGAFDRRFRLTSNDARTSPPSNPVLVPRHVDCDSGSFLCSLAVSPSQSPAESAAPPAQGSTAIPIQHCRSLRSLSSATPGALARTAPSERKATIGSVTVGIGR